VIKSKGKGGTYTTYAEEKKYIYRIFAGKCESGRPLERRGREQGR
jgi:hypothetical protein